MPARRGSIVLVFLAALAILGGTAATLLSGKRGTGGPPSSTTDGPDPAASHGWGPGYDRNRAPAKAATVDVLVLRFPERTPIAGAQVVLHTGPGRMERTTDAAGRASFADALTGRARLDTFAEGFEPDQRTADLRPDSNRTVEILLVESAFIEGHVVAAADGAPIEGARVQPRGEPHFSSIVSLEGGGYRQVHDPRATQPATTTGADGSFRLRVGRPGGCILLDASAPGFAPELATVWIPEVRSVPASAEIRLARTGRIRGTVRDARGLPVDGAAVRTLTATGELHQGGATSGPDGAFVVEGLAVDAIYKVLTLGWTAGRVKPGRPPISRGVDVHLPADPGEATVDLVLPGVGTLKVDWADASGRNDGGAHCYAFPLDDSGRSPESGRNRPAGPGFDLLLAEGRYRVLVLSLLHGAGEAEAVVVADAESSVRVVMGAGPALEGIVVDEADRPLAGVLVRALRAGEAAAAGNFDPGRRAAPSPVHELVEAQTRHVRPGGVELHAALSVEGSLAVPKLDALPGAARQARTDAAGRFRLGGLVAGTSWLLAVRDSGLHVEPAGPFVVPTMDIRLVGRRFGGLHGRLFLPAGAAVPSMLSIHFESESSVSGGTPTLRTTGAFGDGSFRLEGLPPGKGRFWAESATAFFAPVEVVVAPGEVADLGTLSMEPALTLVGRIIRPTGEPAYGARVQVFGAEPVTTGVEGTFSIGGLRAGEVVARVYADRFDGASSVTVRVTLPRADGAGPVEIRIGSPGVIFGTARDAATRPLAGWRVRARPPSEPASHHDRSATVNHRGMYDLRLPAGTWLVTLHPHGSSVVAAEATVTMPDNGRATVDFEVVTK